MVDKGEYIEDEDDIKIDWDKLQEINKDVIGWIKINNTNIDYPILKDSDELKYLKHSYDGRHNDNGSIFTLDNKPFESDVTIVYGHNMKSGIMFSALSKYMEKNFFDEHKIIYVYTKNQNYKATVFSFYSIGINQEKNNIRELNFNDEIQYYKNKSIYNNEDVDNIKKILKLSTCSYLNTHTTPTDQRYYLVASLEKCFES